MNNDYGRNARNEILRPLVRSAREISESQPMTKLGYEARCAIAQAGRCMMGQARLRDAQAFLSRIIQEAK